MNLINRIIPVLLAVILFGVTACSPQKKLHRAEQAVLTDKEAFNYVGGIWAKLNPCFTDTVIKYTTNEVYKIDTFYNHGDIVTAPGTHDTVRIVKTIKSTDTIKVYWRDKRMEGILQDSIVTLKIDKGNAQTAYEIQKQETNKKSKLAFLLLMIIVFENIAIILYKAKTL